ncbi:MAG TPA: YciI family protein [Blastocatellia bacterium]
MQYLLLIYGNEKDYYGLSGKDQEALHGRYRSLVEEIVKTGNYKGGEQLQPVSTASTVRVRNAKVTITDGPFAETHEQLGGYFLIEAKDLDEATAIAARIPGAESGSIEVRPIVMRS